MTLPLEGGQVAHVRDLFTVDLWSVLVSAVDAREAVQKIVYGKHRAEAVRLAPTFQERCAPMGSDALRRQLGDEARRRGLDGVSEEDLDRVLKPYMAALLTLSADVLTEAFRRWNAGEYFGSKKPMSGLSETMPTAHQLQELAMPALKEVQTVAWRLRKVVEAVDRMPKHVTPSERPTRADLIAQGVLDENGRAILTKSTPIPEAF
jgi:hypothetical protein